MSECRFCGPGGVCSSCVDDGRSAPGATTDRVSDRDRTEGENGPVSIPREILNGIRRKGAFVYFDDCEAAVFAAFSAGEQEAEKTSCATNLDKAAEAALAAYEKHSQTEMDRENSGRICSECGWKIRGYPKPNIHLMIVALDAAASFFSAPKRYSETEVSAALKCHEEWKAQHPNASVWSVFSHLEGRCGCEAATNPTQTEPEAKSIEEIIPGTKSGLASVSVRGKQ